MTKNKFFELVIDKIILASLIAAFSTAALFGYNLFNKAFDSAREQSRAFSTFAVENKSTILSASKEIRTALTSLHYRSNAKETKASKAGAARKGRNAEPDEDSSATKIQYEMIRQLVQMDSAINALVGSNLVKAKDTKNATTKSKSLAEPKVETFKEAASTATEISTVLRPLVASFQSTEGGNLPNANVMENFAKVNKAEARFVEAFNHELGAALSSEFSQFYESYYLGVPWYGQPTFLIVLAIGSLVICCMTYFLLPGEPPAPAKSTPPQRFFVRLLK